MIFILFLFWYGWGHAVFLWFVINNILHVKPPKDMFQFPYVHTFDDDFLIFSSFPGSWKWCRLCAFIRVFLCMTVTWQSACVTHCVMTTQTPLAHLKHSSNESTYSLQLYPTMHSDHGPFVLWGMTQIYVCCSESCPSKVHFGVYSAQCVHVCQKLV